MSELLLHIGAHKTGTTSFQYWLMNNRILLNNLGYYFPVTATLEGCNHAPLARELRTSNCDFTLWNDLIAELSAHSNKIVIVSSEDFSDLNTLEIEKLKGYLSHHFDKIGIYFTARNPNFAVASHWGLLLKQGYIDCDFTSFVSMGYFGADSLFSLRKYNYEEVLTPWINSYDRKCINVNLYSEGRDSLKEIILAMNISIKPEVYRDAERKKINSAPSEQCSLVLMLCNRMLNVSADLSPERKREITCTVYDDACEYYKNSSAKHSFFTKSSLRILDAYYSDSISWLNNNFGVNVNFSRVGIDLKCDDTPHCLTFKDIDYWTNVILKHIEYKSE